MDDRRMLELAAKAAGYRLQWKTGHCKGGEFRGAFIDEQDDAWNPSTDDGDALRLAVACGLSIDSYPYHSLPKHSVIVKQRRRGDQMRETNPTQVVEVYGDDAAAATRLAITRAAAEIGEQMEVLG